MARPRIRCRRAPPAALTWPPVPGLTERVAPARLGRSFRWLPGAPIGAGWFALGAAWPFAAQAVLLLASAVLVTRIVLPPAPARVATRAHREIVEALRWTWAHANVRTLVLTICLFNLTYGAA